MKKSIKSGDTDIFDCGESISLADMHTHSENSHDSLCKAEDMCVSQMKKGTRIFALTDHFDTELFDKCDIFSPIKKSAEKAKELNKKYGGKCLALAGIELGEGFWYPEIYKRAMALTDYDVVIGSVHQVRYKELTYPYSKIDFSKLVKEEIYQYLETYFDDVITMTETTDFDVLAHLTCPLRYIKHKYKIDVDLCRFEKKIDRILELIIKKEIALEINTSGYDSLGETMPPERVLKNYREAGGRLITLGSDAHTAENASKHFDKAVKEIKKIGFKSVFYYKDRKPFKIKIQ